MNYQHTPEHLRPHELSGAGQLREQKQESALTRAAAETLVSERLLALASISGNITGRMREALVNKLGYEQDALLLIVEAREKAARARHAHVLPKQYFVRKQLDVELF